MQINEHADDARQSGRPGINQVNNEWARRLIFDPFCPILTPRVLFGPNLLPLFCEFSKNDASMAQQMGGLEQDAKQLEASMEQI